MGQLYSTDHFIIVAIAGAVMMSFIYHLILYIQLRSALLQAYTSYLFVAASYILFRSFFPDRNNTPSDVFDIDEMLQMFSFIFYIRFMSVAMELNRKNEKWAYLFARAAPFIIITSVAVYQILIMQSSSTPLIEIGIVLAKFGVRIYLLLAGFFLLLSVLEKRKGLFYRFIAGGAICIILFGGLATLVHVFSPNGFIVAAVCYTITGMFLDVVFFSAAVACKLHEDVKAKAEISRQLAEVQLTALNAQMNPHFIFNCMNSIQKYILKNERDKALFFLQNFSQLIRGVLDNSTKVKIPLVDEVRMLEKYLQLEQQRLENRFSYHLQVPSDLQDDFFEIPGMIIQPYVENAIWHGLMNLPEDRRGVLSLEFSWESSQICCRITDNGVGRKRAAELDNEKNPKHKSYGMAIAQRRLLLLQEEGMEMPQVIIDDLYNSRQEPSGTRVSIFIQTV